MRAWLLPASVLIVPAALLLVAVPLYRVRSIPDVDPGFSPEEFARPLTPQEQELLNHYGNMGYEVYPYIGTQEEEEQKRKDASRLTALGIKWRERSQEAIAVALKASREKFVYPVDDTETPRWLGGMARLLVASAARLEEEGKLDAAFEHYLAALRVAEQVRDWYPLLPIEFNYLYGRDHSGLPIEWEVYSHLPSWAARPGQTPERLIAAARQLEEITSGASASDEIKIAYLRVRRFLDGRPGSVPSIVRGSQDEPVPPLTMLWLHLPWERTRPAVAESVDARTARRRFVGGRSGAKWSHDLAAAGIAVGGVRSMDHRAGVRLCPARADPAAAHFVHCPLGQGHSGARLYRNGDAPPRRVFDRRAGGVEAPTRLAARTPPRYSRNVPRPASHRSLFGKAVSLLS